MTVSNTLLSLTHRPYGRNHPYEQDATERFPRDPIAGQPVTLGIATRPAGAAEAVWVEWHVEGSQKSFQLQAVPAEETNEQTLWHVQLPSFTANDQVSYYLGARQGERQLRSENFSFSVPYWLSATQVVDYYCAADRCVLVCADQALKRTFNLVLSFRSPGLHHFQWMPASNEPPTGASSNEGEPSYQILEETATRIHLATERCHLIIHRSPFRLEVTKADGTVLLRETLSPTWLIDGKEETYQLEQTFASPIEEAFYGFGERFNALDQRGNRLDNRVFEQYKDQGLRTYIPVPFFFSSLGYGIYFDTNHYLEYDLAAADPEQWFFRAELNQTGEIAYFLIIDDDPKKIVSRFTDLVGKPAMPPAWAFGPWMSSNDWNSQALVMEQIRQTGEHRIPATIMVIEAWSDESTFYIWNDADYEPVMGADSFSYDDFLFPAAGLWPDPKGMIDELHRQGLRTILWQIPVMKKLESPNDQHARDEAYMVEKGYCVHEADGTPYKIRPFWFRDGLLWDVTNEAGVAWWMNKRAYLLDEMGVDGFKTDGGEHMWGGDLRFADGREGKDLWNLYPNLYVTAYHNFANERRNGQAITFSRAGFTGAQATPCHWAGDENSTWSAFRSSILAGLSAGMSGISFWGWDLAGFSGDIPTAELYLRSAAMATFCPIMQYHSEYNARQEPSRDRTPWNMQKRTGDSDVIPVFRYFANLRMNLLPYILSEAWRSSETGVPLMRALSLEFPDDARCREYPYQYLFGSSLLVAPVVEPGRELWDVYLPEGQWFDFWTGEKIGGGQTITYAVPKDRIPVFVRQGAIVPLNLDSSVTLGSDVGNDVDSYRSLCFKIYPIGVVTYDWYDVTSQEMRRLCCTLDEDTGKLLVDIPPILHQLILKLCIRDVDRVLLNDEPLPEMSMQNDHLPRSGNSWYEDVKRGEVSITLAAWGRGAHPSKLNLESVHQPRS